MRAVRLLKVVKLQVSMSSTWLPALSQITNFRASRATEASIALLFPSLLTIKTGAVPSPLVNAGVKHN